ncbi:MAG: family oxidoreductase [Alphaproteobacteria bacterium]|nr:family oxidoreductase [Alphaproteobacteria bacterium]
MTSYDYVVIGAGSAGCVVANRLVNAGKSVLLLEAGPADRDFFIKIPGGIQKIDKKLAWNFWTEPEAGVSGRRVFMRQGKLLGGGSSINGMVYVRGQARDYDDWAAEGCTGWGWDEVLPVYKRLEANQKFADPFHGTDGPLKVGDAGYHHPLSYAFVRAAQEAGIPYNEDFNGARQDGVGFYQITAADGLRQSAVVAFLAPIRGNRLLTLRTEASVEAITTENGAASGVSYRTSDNVLHRALVREEVILCAGAFGSPKLLQLSGIGPGGLLAEHAIRPVRELAGVGENLQDHFQAGVYGRTREPSSLFGHDKGLRAVRHGLQWLLFRSGLLTSNVVESGGFVDTDGSGRPDIQFTVVAALTGDADRPPLPGHGLSISPCNLRPRARGHVRIRSARPDDAPSVWANALGDPADMDTLVRGVELARRILHSPSLARLIECELAPGTGPGPVDRETIETHVRRVLKTVYHPGGTCRMGNDERAVVDPRLQVHGVPRLRVADASIMPNLVSGNTNAPAIMIGERCADFLLGETR